MTRGRWSLALAAALAVGALLLVWAARGWGGAGADDAQRRREAGQPVAGRNLPLIFIGGVPRSGTTLMRAMLDAHPDVRCGPETRVMQHIINMRLSWARSQYITEGLDQAGVTRDVLDNAIAAFCLEVIARHNEMAPRLCNKDPLLLLLSTYLLQLFPNAKVVLMVRDGRAVAHSLITRKLKLPDFDLSSYRQCLKKWNHLVEVMYQQCRALGPARCLPVRYEALVLRPRETLREVLAFLGLSWTDAVLHHEQYINQPHGVALSNLEWSSPQVKQSLYSDALARWVGALPAGVRADMAALAPMLSVLGYDPWANPPRYHALGNTLINDYVRDYLL